MGKAVRHQQQGEYAEAERLYTELIEKAPEFPDAHHFMGLLAHQTGRAELADAHLRRSLALDPRRAEFHFNYAKVLMDLGRMQDAAREFQETLELDPRMPDAWQGLAQALHALEHHLQAAACLQRCLELKPDDPSLWRFLGECLQAESLHEEAAEAYRRAARLAPGDAGLHVALAATLTEMRRDVEAGSELDRALKLAPDSPEVHYQRGISAANRGDFADARAALEKALALAPDFFQAALYYSYITPLPVDAPLVQRLLEAARKAVWGEPGQGANVHFTLGYVFDKAGHYDAAFGHYHEANRLQRGLHVYSTASQRHYQTSLQRAFGADFLERARRFSNPSVKPIFIVGMPRSGTSLLEQMLASHPEVHGGGEMVFLHAAIRRRLGSRFRGDFADDLAALPDAELADIAAALLAHMEGLAPGARHVTDKLPSNFMLLGLLHALFPSAAIIHCRRDPMDTCVSCYTTSFKQGHRFSNDLRELGEYHRLYELAMAHWRKTLPEGRLYEIRYEDLVGDTGPELRRLLEHCGLAWDESCLRFQENRRPVNTASVYQVRQPVYRSSVGNWRRFEAHLAPLLEVLRDSPLV